MSEQYPCLSAYVMWNEIKKKIPSIENVFNTEKLHYIYLYLR